MKLAIKWDSIKVDEAGHVTGHSAGDILVWHTLRNFPNSALIGDTARRCEGFTVAPLGMFDPNDVAVINMDVINSSRLWQKMYDAGAEKPRVMSFMWWSPSDIQAVEGITSMTLSCTLFPVFANSERTASEVREICHEWTVKPLHEQVQLG